MEPRVLVVDDEEDLVQLVRYNLIKEGYLVDYAYDGEGLLGNIRQSQPDLILLDVMLPDHSGYVLCQMLKSDERTRHIPIIMLTARSAEGDRIKGFECGADDYVVKPFSTKELVLRVKAMLSRTRQEASECVTLGPIAIYPETFRVFVHDQEVTLTRTEFQLLLVLAKRPNVVKTREQLLEDVWQDQAECVLDRTVDAQIKRLRTKLGPAREMIQTLRGVGYRATEDVSPMSTLTSV